MKLRRPLATVLPLALLALAAPARTPIQHVVVIVQENHSFDSYFSDWCGQTKRCQPGPAADPGTGVPPTPLTDASTMAYDPNHNQSCELKEIDGGKMDGYVNASDGVGYPCGNPLNFQYAAADGTSPVAPYHQWASQYALAANNFQSIAGASSSNDMYFWTSKYVFTDNQVEPDAVGKQCSTNSNVQRYDDATHPNLGALLDRNHVSWSWYAEGYDEMVAASTTPAGCPVPPADCNAHIPSYPCVFDPSDIPSEYYASSADNPAHMRDYQRFLTDLGGSLPAVSFVKARGYRSEHPGYGTKDSDGVKFVTDTVAAVGASPYARSTLVLVAWDESGGYFDHVAPPPASKVDGQPYGPRVPLLAVGPFAAKGVVSNVLLEHSSIPKFIEWNWLGDTGQLHGRDRFVHNLGSLIDPAYGVPR